MFPPPVSLPGLRNNTAPYFQPGVAVVGTFIVKFIVHSSPGASVILESERVIHDDNS